MDALIRSNLTAAGRLPVIVAARGHQSQLAATHLLDRTPDAQIKDSLPIIGGYTAEMAPEDFKRLAAQLPAGVSLTVDARRQWLEPTPELTASTSAAALDGQAPEGPPAPVVETLGVDKVWAQGFKGQGIGIAVIDTGIHPHSDLKDRLVAFKDFVNGESAAYDDQGHGTHVAGDAAGDGTASAGKYMGTAPEAKLIGIKTLAANGSGRYSDIIKGVQWAVQNRERYNIRVMNMSLGGQPISSYKDDPVCMAVERAQESNIVAVIAAGNSGPKPETIGSPGMDPNVLTVGALNDKGTVERTDDDVAIFSSRGPTKPDGLVKPDILAPGVNITAANSPGSMLDKMDKIPHVGRDYITISGTSMATPVMAGIVADLLSANPQLTPAQVKEIVTSTAQGLGHTPPYDGNTQGAGVVDAKAALDKAIALAKAPAAFAS